MAGPAAVLAIEVNANTNAANASLMRTQAELDRTAASAKAAGTSMEASAAKSAASWKKAGATMSTVGKSMTKYITLPAIAVGAAATKLALDFDKSMTLIQTQAGASRQEVEKLSKSVLDFAKSGKTQFSPNELAQALYSIESAGIHGAKAMQTLKASSQLATVGQADLASTTKALAAAQKTGIKGSANLKTAIGTLNATVGAGQMHMDDLVSAMGTGFLSAASQLGISLSDLGGALAELTKQGVPAAAAATRLRMTFTSLATISTRASAADAMKSIGLAANELGNTLRSQGLMAALEQLQNHLKGLSEAQQTNILATAFGGAKSSTTISALLNNLGDLNTTLGSIHDNANKVGKSFHAMQQDPEVKLQRAWAQLQGVLIDLGNNIIPKLVPLVMRLSKVMGGLLDFFIKMPSWAQDFLLGAVVAGPFIRMAGGLIKVATAARAAAVAFGLLGTAETGAAAGGAAKWTNIGTRIGGWMGPAIGAASAAGMLVIWRNQIDDFFHSHGMTLPGQTVPGNAQQPLNDPRGITGVATGAASGIKGLLGQGGPGVKSTPLGAYMRTNIGEIDKLVKRYGTLSAASTHWSQADLASWKMNTKNALHYGQINRDQYKLIMRVLSDTTNASGKDVKKFAQIFDLNQKDIRGQADKTQSGVSDSASKMSKNVGQSYTNMTNAAAEGINLLKTNTNAALSALGVKQAINFIVKHQTLQGQPGHHQRGGSIPGSGTGDTVPAMLEPGEFVLNRKAVEKIGPTRLEAMNKALPRFQKGGRVSGMQAMVGEVNKFEQHHFPYSWGGGHAGFGIQPVDCSGFVSDVLHSAGLLSAPMVSGSLMNWGKSGHGPLTVYANPEHTFMSLNGRFAGTSSSNPGGGAGWVEGGYPPSYLSGFAARTMQVAGGVAAAAQKIARVILQGPKGSMTDMGQRALDKTRDAANAYIAKHAPSGKFGGGQSLADLGKKGWHKTGATAEGLDGQMGKYGVVGGMGFAELLLAGANAGMHPNLEDIIGARVPGMGKVGFKYGNRMAIAVKNDIGSGQAGNPHYTVDIQTGLAKALGWHPNADVEVKRLMRGGLVPSFGGGGIVAGPRGKPQAAIVHGGEKITPPGQTRYAITITNWDKGTGYMEEIADSAVNGQHRLTNQISRMRR